MRPTPSNERPLQGWKEIATYLDRDQRTAIRWEKEDGLPVRRLRESGRAAVYAYPSEIEAWRCQRKLQSADSPPSMRSRVHLAYAIVTGIALTAGVWWLLDGPVLNPPGPLAEAADGSGIEVHQLWTGEAVDVSGRVSPDGRFLSFVDWSTGNLAIRDFESGEHRVLTNTSWANEPSEYAGQSVISDDGRRIAFQWIYEACFCVSVRLGDLDAESGDLHWRELYTTPKNGYISPMDFSPDGSEIVAVQSLPDRTYQILSISTGSGELRPLKSFGWRQPRNVYFAPGGDSVLYDLPPTLESNTRDLYLLAVDGSDEIRLVEHPADERALGWTPEGGHVLFSSDRTGTRDAWLLPVADGRPVGEPRLVTRNLGLIAPLGFAGGRFLYGVTTGTQNVYSVPFDQSARAIGEGIEKISSRFDGRAHGPEWAPDGERLAYVVGERPGGRGPWSLVVREIQSGAERLVPLGVTTYRYVLPRWSPDGRRLVLAGQDLKGREGVFLIDPQTGASDVLTMISEGAVREADWAKDGRSIFYIQRLDGESAIIAHELGASGKTELLRLEGRPMNSLAVSPEGDRLVFRRGVEIGVFSLAGRELRWVKIASGSLNAPVESDGCVGCSPGIGNLAWSADGETLIFNYGVYPNYSLWSVASVGGPAKSLDLAMDGIGFLGLRVHPNGDQLAFQAMKGDKSFSEVWALENIVPSERTAR